MDEPSTSGSPPSTSVVVPESPGSPNLLDPPSPDSPGLGSLLRLDTNPEIFEQPEDEYSNIGTDSGPINFSESSRSNWRRLDDENSNSALPHSSTNEDSNSTAIQSMNEESNSMLSIPEAQVRKSDDHSDEPPSKVRKISSPKTDDMDGETCPICLDSWGNSGDHRLVALKCGHLFGSQCVERWLKAQISKDRSCPTCKSKAHLKDLRHIYARRLVAADTSQVTTLQNQIHTLQAEKSRAELDLQKSRIAHRACLLQLEVLRSTLMKCQVAKEPPVRRSFRFALEKNLEISREGGCRVMTYNCRSYELYVSQKSTNTLFPGFGIRKVSCVDYKLGQFVHLHPKPIRDITYSQRRDLLLSVGLDSTARIMERGNACMTVNAGFPLWSCSWDYMRTNEFYVGGVGGVIHQYDVRNSSTYMQRLSAPSDISPVVSLCSTEHGLLSCQLNSCWLWTSNMRQWEPRTIPIDGPFMSLCYDNESHRALISCRSGLATSDRSRLTLCKLRSSVPSGEVLFDVEQTLNGSAKSSIMSRAAWVKTTGASWVAAHSESDSMLYLHGLDGARSISLLAAEPALDVCSAQINGDTIVASLSESRLRLYKSVAMNS
ncbi:E3 ubiquitin-protein ligase RFWD3-like [Ostrinia furnacalis]|uniref:E3 ubiquitin-protein ligase RFWD3-like n=1 Tax=Ostrinia furnacalis TaxID=93504 RepID=UPI00103E6E28|nr:E3 ubiquitin-protein ligase RFWD3-like [Ostrinia furnacalis]